MMDEADADSFSILGARPKIRAEKKDNGNKVQNDPSRESASTSKKQVSIDQQRKERRTANNYADGNDWKYADDMNPYEGPFPELGDLDNDPSVNSSSKNEDDSDFEIFSVPELVPISSSDDGNMPANAAAAGASTKRNSDKARPKIQAGKNYNGKKVQNDPSRESASTSNKQVSIDQERNEPRTAINNSDGARALPKPETIFAPDIDPYSHSADLDHFIDAMHRPPKLEDIFGPDPCDPGSSDDVNRPDSKANLAAAESSTKRNSDMMMSPRRPSSSFPMPPDVLAELASQEATFQSLNLNADDNGAGPHSFLFMDESEVVQLKSAEQFCRKLGASPETKLKVVSIFGNTGDGKSHTLNHAFFGGTEVFRTSAEQTSCTMGVWASYHRQHNVLCLDTEGLLGESQNANQQMRMLLKVLAISDIVIYRTRSERLRTDMYTFLGTASKTFTKYFSEALQSVCSTVTPQSLGPAVIIFQETQNTVILKETADGKTEEEILRESFAKLKLDLLAFSSLRYVGTQTNQPPTNYEPLKMALEKELKDRRVRSPRQPKVVFEALMALNRKFSGELPSQPLNTFPEQYFTCTSFCKSCNARCQLSMGHIQTKEDHMCSGPCAYQHQYENKVYMCKSCYINGREVVVKLETESTLLGLAKYAWSGAFIQCPHCGIIYRKWQHWYGNKGPESVVRSEIVHIWDDEGTVDSGPTNTAQVVLDGVAYLTEAIASVGAQPTKTIKDWVTDKIRPEYWRPDSEIIHCKGCTAHFERYDLKKHHCRHCGEGFCNNCSKNRMPVFSRGWSDPVRVCNGCRDELLRAQRANGDMDSAAAAALDEEIEQALTSSTGNNNPGDGDVLARKYGEVVMNTLSNLGAVLEYPKDLIKDSARPSYWVPDADAPHCHICQMLFGTPEEINLSTPLIRAGTSINGRRHSPPDSAAGSPSRSGFSAALDRRRHHCRACGNAVCAACSDHRQPVPKRGWTSDVRVCNTCFSSAE